jgi:hypothetical protein
MLIDHDPIPLTSSFLIPPGIRGCGRRPVVVVRAISISFADYARQILYVACENAQNVIRADFL